MSILSIMSIVPYLALLAFAFIIMRLQPVAVWTLAGFVDLGILGLLIVLPKGLILMVLRTATFFLGAITCLLVTASIFIFHAS